MFKQLLKGIGTYIPLIKKLCGKSGMETKSARYCYSIWLRHLVRAEYKGLPTDPKVVAELGPGWSIGTGLAALLSGADKYYAFDVDRHANEKRNVMVFDELVELFRKCERIPDDAEYPGVNPRLESYEFPHSILTESRLKKNLSPNRIMAIRNAILNSGDDSEDIVVSYAVPWNDAAVVREGSVDMIFSQAVLEHVEDTSYTYETLYRWLKPGGFMSHQIDFRCHGTAKEWNGHWAYSNLTWKIIKGNRTHLINRLPHSRHIELLEKNSFNTVCDIRNKDNSGIGRNQLAKRFKNISDDDLATNNAFIQAIKK